MSQQGNQQNRQQQQSQKQTQKQIQEAQQAQILEAQLAAQAKAQRTSELNTQQVYQQIINEEKKVFGMKYPNRTKEPSMFDLLSWEDNKQQKQDFKSGHLPQNQIDQYKALINKSNTTFQTEQRDNYRQFYLDKQEGVLVPEVEPEVLERLRGIQISNQHGVVVTQEQENKQQQYQNNQSQHIGAKSNYQREHEIADIKNPNELIALLNKNHKVNQKQTQALLEQAQKDKRSKIQVNNFYEEPEQFHNQNQEEDEDYEDEEAAENQQQNIKEQQRLQRIQEQEARNEAAKIKKFGTCNTKNVKSKLIKYKPQAQKLDPKYQKERINRREERIKQMEETTRWLPNSAFTTYFGKPAFENYGRGNVNPSIGGCVYGQYLLSHNVNPHRGIHQPKFIQSYNNALNYGERLPDAEPQPPRNVKEDFRLSQNQVEELKNRNPLTATKNNRDNLRIQKPDLINSLRFASNENSPVNVAKDDEEKRKRIKEGLKELREGTKAHTKSFTQFQDFTQDSKPNQSQGIIKGTNGQRPQTAISSNNNTQGQKSVKYSDNQQQQQQQQQQQNGIYVSEEQLRANQEWANDLPNKKIIDELNRKKAKKNRLALKVTEVIPVLPPNANQNNTYNTGAGVSSTNYHNARSQSPSNRPQTAQQRYQVQEIDLHALPIEAQSELREKLHNPKLYKNTPSQFTKHIPYAGKALTQQDDIKSVFHYENIEDPADYVY